MEQLSFLCLLRCPFISDKTMYNIYSCPGSKFSFWRGGQLKLRTVCHKVCPGIRVKVNVKHDEYVLSTNLNFLQMFVTDMAGGCKRGGWYDAGGGEREEGGSELHHLCLKGGRGAPPPPREGGSGGRERASSTTCV